MEVPAVGVKAARLLPAILCYIDDGQTWAAPSGALRC